MVAEFVPAYSITGEKSNRMSRFQQELCHFGFYLSAFLFGWKQFNMNISDAFYRSVEIIRRIGYSVLYVFAYIAVVYIIKHF